MSNNCIVMKTNLPENVFTVEELNKFSPPNRPIKVGGIVSLLVSPLFSNNDSCDINNSIIVIIFSFNNNSDIYDRSCIFLSSNDNTKPFGDLIPKVGDLIILNSLGNFNSINNKENGYQLFKSSFCVVNEIISSLNNLSVFTENNYRLCLCEGEFNSKIINLNGNSGVWMKDSVLNNKMTIKINGIEYSMVINVCLLLQNIIPLPWKKIRGIMINTIDSIAINLPIKNQSYSLILFDNPE